MFDFLRRRRPTSTGPPSEAVTTAAGWVSGWQRLDTESAERLVGLTEELVDRLGWEAASGFELTDDIAATVAAHAALLTLELPADSLDEVGPIIVHATTIETHGPHAVGEGLVSDDTLALAGEAHHRGPVLLAWDSVSADLRHPDHGHSVILHELAHHLDMADGWVDGTPPLAGSARRPWIEACTDALERLRDGHSPLDPYGAQGPGEFFAVATEAFFSRPAQLRHHEPALYDVLGGYYGQDPAARGVGGPYAARP